VTLQKYFSHLSLVIYIFCNLTHKIETETVNGWKTTIKQTIWTNHYDWPIRNTEQADHINNYTFLSLVHSFTASAQIVPKFWAKTILLKQHKVSSLSFRLEQQTGHYRRYPQVCTYG
jgi:hypothetical protein